MATLSIRPSKHGGKSVSYTKDVKSHNEDFERCIALSGLNCNPENARAEFQVVWDRYGLKAGEKIQTYNLIESFSNEEYDPDNPDDVLKVNDIGHALAKKLYPDRQVVVATQADNKGRNLHNHIIVNNVNPVDGTRLSGEKTRWVNLSKEHDEVLREFGANVIERDSGKAFDKQTIKEIKLRDSGRYVWKDDLKTRIETCLDDETIKNKTDFKQKMLEEYQVDVRIRKNGNISYHFTDKEEKQRKIRAGKLGLKYGKDGVEYAIASNKERIEPIQARDYTRLDTHLPDTPSPEPSDRFPQPEYGRDEEGFELSHTINHYLEYKPYKRRRVVKDSDEQSKNVKRRTDRTADDHAFAADVIRQINADFNRSHQRQRQLRSDRDLKNRKSRTSEFDQP